LFLETFGEREKSKKGRAVVVVVVMVVCDGDDVYYV